MQIANSLKRQTFDPEVHNHESECIICMQSYERDDIVTQLSCHPSHYFHLVCIEDWIKSGKNSCPICRHQIKDLNLNNEAADENALE